MKYLTSMSAVLFLFASAAPGFAAEKKAAMATVDVCHDAKLAASDQTDCQQKMDAAKNKAAKTKVEKEYKAKISKAK